MKAITLWQPHASLIAWGLKPYETRDWLPRVNEKPYRGPIAIHASKSMTELDSLMKRLRELESPGPPIEHGFLRAFAHAIFALKKVEEDKSLDFKPYFPMGAIVATAELTAVYDAAELHPKLKFPACDFGDFGKGRYAWRIEKVKPLKEPVYVAGKQGLWEWTP